MGSGAALATANILLAAGVLVFPVDPTTQTWGSLTSAVALITDADIWRAALLITQCFRRDAADQAAACADDLLAAGEIDGCAMWKRIMIAIERLQAQRPGEGEALQ